MATISDSQAVFGVVLDAIRVLDWSAGEESRLVRADGESVPVLAEELIQTYRAALDQAHRSFFELALRTLRGENGNFPLTAVLAELERAGWTGALREFKLRVLELSRSSTGYGSRQQRTSGRRQNSQRDLPQVS